MKQYHGKYENIFFQIVEAKERDSTPAWRLQAEVTRCHNIALVYQGEAIFEYNNQKYRVKEGDLIYYEQGAHRSAYNSAGNCVCFWAIDFFYTMPKYDAGWHYGETPLHFNTVEPIQDTYLFRRLKALFRKLVNTWLTEKIHRDLQCQRLMLDIYKLLLMWKFHSSFSYDRIRKTEKVMAYIQDNYHRKITLKELGQQVNITGSYLSKIFKEEYGMSLFDCLLELRIGKACELLISGCSVAETAKKTGFRDEFYFSRCFKQYTGVAPSQYRLGNSWTRQKKLL